MKEMEDSLTWVMWSDVLTDLQSFMRQYEYVAVNFLIFLENDRGLKGTASLAIVDSS